MVEVKIINNLKEKLHGRIAMEFVKMMKKYEKYCISLTKKSIFESKDETEYYVKSIINMLLMSLGEKESFYLNVFNDGDKLIDDINDISVMIFDVQNFFNNNYIFSEIEIKNKEINLTKNIQTTKLKFKKLGQRKLIRFDELKDNEGLLGILSPVGELVLGEYGEHDDILDYFTKKYHKNKKHFGRYDFIIFQEGSCNKNINKDDLSYYSYVVIENPMTENQREMLVSLFPKLSKTQKTRVMFELEKK